MTAPFPSGTTSTAGNLLSPGTRTAQTRTTISSDSAGLDRTHKCLFSNSDQQSWLANLYLYRRNPNRCLRFDHSSSPSTSCTSCVHNETLLDNLGARWLTILLTIRTEKLPPNHLRYKRPHTPSTIPYRGTASGQETLHLRWVKSRDQVIHADNLSVKRYFGSAVTTGAGGIASPLCGVFPYFPTLVVDEAGNKAGNLG